MKKMKYKVLSLFLISIVSSVFAVEKTPVELFNDLGLKSGSEYSEQIVKKAYRELALIHHPDKDGDPQCFIKINGAYEALNKLIKEGRISSNGVVPKNEAQQKGVREKASDNQQESKWTSDFKAPFGRRGGSYEYAESFYSTDDETDDNHEFRWGFWNESKTPKSSYFDEKKCQYYYAKNGQYYDCYNEMIQGQWYCFVIIDGIAYYCASDSLVDGCNPGWKQYSWYSKTKPEPENKKSSGRYYPKTKKRKFKKNPSPHRKKAKKKVNKARQGAQAYRKHCQKKASKQKQKQKILAQARRRQKADACKNGGYELPLHYYL